MQNIKVGDPYSFIPPAFITEKEDKAGRQSLPRMLHGHVIYIHPQRRFFIAEAELHGYKLRETFYF